jgi:uncharacterized membrane protein (UPF0127 family)
MKKSALLSILLTFILVAQAYGGDVALRIGRHAIQAEVADTLEAQQRGLMHRRKLCPDCGMLFVFAAPARYGFWMKNTPLPLAIAFIGSDGRIINIAEMQPDTLDVHYPEREAGYALEMNGRWFAAQGVRAGDRVEGLPRPSGAASTKAR